MTQFDSFPSLNVFAMGCRAAGKTVFLATMFRKLLLCDETSDGFALTCPDGIAAKQLREAYYGMAKGRHFPPGNLSTTEYTFLMGYNGQDFFRINWVDYRGGLLGEPDHPDYTSLVSHLYRADVLLVFYDSTLLTTSEDEDRDVLTQTLTQYFAQNPKKDLSIALVLTKTDGSGIDQRDPEEVRKLFDRARRRFRRLLDTTVKADSAQRVASIIPVSCTGPFCRPCEGKPGEFELVGSGFQPEGVEYPLLWAMAFGLSGARRDVLSTIANIESSEKELGQSRSTLEAKSRTITGVIKNTWNRWWGNETVDDKIDEIDSKNRQLASQLDVNRQTKRQISDALERANASLEHLPIFTRDYCSLDHD